MIKFLEKIKLNIMYKIFSIIDMDEYKNINKNIYHL